MRTLKVGAVAVAALLVAAACQSSPNVLPQTTQAPGPVVAAPYAPQSAPIAMIPADKRTSEQWMEYLGLRLVESRDASGPPAWTPEPGKTYFFTNESTTWGATNTRNGIVVIDAATKKVVAQSKLPDEYSVGYSSHGIAVSADAKYVYLPALGKRNFTLVVDARTFKIAKVYESLGRPHHINNFRTADGKEQILVTDFGWNWAGSGFYVIDPAQDNKIVGGMSRNDFSGHPYVVSNEAGKFIYATVPAPTSALREHMEGYLAKIDTTTWKVVLAVPMIDPIWPEITADGKFAWVTLGGPSKIAKVDLSAGKVLEEISTGPGPWGARLSYDETKLYVADKGETGGYGQQGRTLTIVDTAIPIVTNVVLIGVTTDHAILSPDGKEVWTTSNADRAIYVVDTATEKVAATIKMPNDGDTHGSTFVRYEKDAKGEILGTVVSSFTGLRGPARAEQLKAIAQSKAPLVQASPRGTGFDPQTLKLPAGKQFLRFLNSSGTGGGPITVDVPGVGQFDLKPGESRNVEVTVPQTGELKITNVKNATYKPLVITAGTAGGTSQAPASDKRAVTIEFEQLQFKTTTLTVKAGETLALTVKNPDDEKHNMVVLNTKIVSPDVSAGRSATFDLTMPDTAGTYKVVCAYHPNTSFELKVEAK